MLRVELLSSSYPLLRDFFVRKVDPTLEALLQNDEGKLDAVFGARHALWVPPDVQVMLLPRPEAPDKDPHIAYPVPENWGQDARTSNMLALEKMGWQCKTDTSGLLNEFLGLAQEEVTTKGLSKVVAFVKRWGPLWLCRTPGHDRNLFGQCYWSRPIHENYAYEEPCSWDPFESAVTFIEVARQANAVLTAARLLWDNKPVPDDVWDTLKPKYFLDRYMTVSRSMLLALSDTGDIPQRKLYLSLIVNEHLGDLGIPRLLLQWTPDVKLLLVNGLGFIRSVWVEIAQVLGNVKGFLQCDGCGGRYLRQGKRRAKTGQRNYCLSCQKGDRGAKKIVAQHRRALQRQAQQLYAEGVSIEEISQQLKPNAGRVKVDPETVRKWVSPEGTMAH